jgi:hypothetical protein
MASSKQKKIKTKAYFAENLLTNARLEVAPELRLIRIIFNDSSFVELLPEPDTKRKAEQLLLIDSLRDEVEIALKGAAKTKISAALAAIENSKTYLC